MTKEDQKKLNDELFKSIENKRLEEVKELLNMGADIESTDADGWTPLHMAFYNGQLDVIKYLFLDFNALMPIRGMFRYQNLMKKKMGRETEAQSIFVYFLQHKSRYNHKEILEFKKEFLKCHMSEEDSRTLKSIIKFL